MDEVWTVRSGRVPYAEATDAQNRLREARLAGEVPTCSRRWSTRPPTRRAAGSTPEELPMGEGWYRMQGIETAETDRGGRGHLPRPGATRRVSDDLPEELRRRRPRLRPPHGARRHRGASVVGNRGDAARRPHRRLDRREAGRHGTPTPGRLVFTSGCTMIRLRASSEAPTLPYADLLSVPNHGSAGATQLSFLRGALASSTTEAGLCARGRERERAEPDPARGGGTARRQSSFETGPRRRPQFGPTLRGDARRLDSPVRLLPPIHGALALDSQPPRQRERAATPEPLRLHAAPDRAADVVPLRPEQSAARTPAREPQSPHPGARDPTPLPPARTARRIQRPPVLASEALRKELVPASSGQPGRTHRDHRDRFGGTCRGAADGGRARSRHPARRRVSRARGARHLCR